MQSMAVWGGWGGGGVVGIFVFVVFAIFMSSILVFVPKNLSFVTSSLWFLDFLSLFGRNKAFKAR